MSYGGVQRPSSGGKNLSGRKLVGKDVANGGLKILPPEDGGQLDREDTWESNGSRPSSGRKGSAGYRPPRTDSATPRRTPTPSKQVHLQAARKKDSNDGLAYGELEEKFDWEEHNKLEQERLSSSSKKSTSKHKNHLKESSIINSRDQNSHFNHEKGYKNHSCDTSRESAKENSDTSAEQMLKMCYKKDNVSDLMQEMGLDESSASSEAGASGGANLVKVNSSGSANGGKRKSKKEVGSSQSERALDIENSDEFDTDLEDGEDSSDSGSEEEEKTKAPSDLLMEFLGYVMSQDWPNAQKLCKMILLYEPEHPEAMKFQGLIEEKMQLEEELANESGSDFDSDDDDDEDDDDSSDDDDSDEETDSDDDEEEEKPKEQQEFTAASHSGRGCETHVRY